ncbi:TIGR01777 family oxidoreductase [Flavobacterium silvaticum]|uniref:TIGR01777 family protein n=1 Tax=Flavobacterium silvaticum TaxID=1852020 RepID=A0A972FU29_9FLAO|nr:TIGR01777 family oxidoreductase [Flavobacterium silvaticum]NMH29329.1 TIGR01777 family protein [Flavobacterium silvaticum]
MKILITGATGLVGTALTNRLLESGHNVNYLTTGDKFPSSMKGAHGFHWNPEKEVFDDAALENVDSIVHLAGANLNHRWTSAYKKKIIESRVLTANLIYQRLQSLVDKPKQFITASGVAIYRDSLTDIYTEKSNETDPSFLGHVVQKWESAADRFAQLGISVCKLRTGPVLAKEAGMLKELETPVKFGLGAALGDGKQWQSWIHINDLVSMYQQAIEKNWSGIYNATAPIAVTNEALMQALAKQAGKPIIIKKIPKFLLKIIFGEMHQMLLSSQHVRPEKPNEKDFHFSFPTLEKALGDLMPK